VNEYLDVPRPRLDSLRVYQAGAEVRLIQSGVADNVDDADIELAGIGHEVRPGDAGKVADGFRKGRVLLEQRSDNAAHENRMRS